MPLENGRIRLVPKPEITACEMCGAGPLPGRMDYVSFDNNAQDVPAGAIETVDHQAGQVGYRVRDGFGHGTTTLIVRKPMVCPECLKTAAELVGYGDRAPLLAELDELQGRLATLEQQYELSEEQRTEAELALRETVVYERLLGAGLPVAKAATAIAKRPSRAKG